MEEVKKEITLQTSSLLEKLTFKKIFGYLFKIGFSILAIYIISQKVGLQRVGFYLKQANWGFLLLAFLVFFISKVIAAFRTNCYYRTQRLYLSEILNLKLSLLAVFYNLFIPMIGGEGYKVYWLNQHYKTGIKIPAWAAFLDRISGVVALLCLAILILPFTMIPVSNKFLVLLAIPLMYITYFFIHRLFFKSFHAAWWKVNGYSIIVQILQVTSTFFIILALNMNHHIFDYLFIFLLASLAFVLPFLGAREMAFVFGASFLGLDPDLSLTISLFFYLSMAVTSLSGLFYFMFPAFLTADKMEKAEVVFDKIEI
jgi:glycosyltransferase 2 family protein